MEKDALIDLIAASGKVAIEYTDLHPIAKSSVKWSIDRVARALKEECSSDIEKIRRGAMHYDVCKVIAIPVPVLNGQNIIFIRAYGGNPTAFFNHLNIQIIADTTVNDNLNFILDLEKKSGIVIYEKQ